jgi:RecB family endonuclease NucS
VNLLLENKSENKILAIELKANIADFRVFGQISMYLSLLETRFPDKTIEGIIIAGEIDNTLKIASHRDKSIKLKSYKMSLELIDE